MSSNGKRFVASLFGVRLSEDVPQLKSLVPQRITNEIIAGQLPKFNPSTIMLAQNEVCHFMDNAALVLKKTEKSYKSYSRGNCYRVAKGVKFHFSAGNVKPIVQEWNEYKEGVIFITNKRIIFVASDNGFEKKLQNLTAVIPYSDAVSLQFRSQIITIMVPQAQLIVMVLKMIG